MFMRIFSPYIVLQFGGFHQSPTEETIFAAGQEDRLYSQ